MARYSFAIALQMMCLSSMTLPAMAQSSGHMVKMSASGQIIEFSFRPYGTIQIAAMIKDIGGKTAVCGIWAETERLQAHIYAGNLPRRARTTTGVELGNTRLLTGLGFTKKAAPEAFEAGAEVPCVLTNVPWQAGFARQRIEFAAPR